MPGTSPIKIVYLYPAGNKRQRSCVIEASADSRRLLLSRGRVNLCWHSCRVEDHLSIMQCFKCSGFSHIAAKYDGEPCCAYCAGEHLSEACNTKSQLKCINCVSAGLSDHSHSARDKDFFTTFNISPLLFEPTHHPGSPHTTIDYICAGGMEATDTSQVHYPSISKHDALFATFPIEVLAHAETTFSCRDFRRLDPVLFGADLAAINWVHVIGLESVDSMVEAFTSSMVELFDRHTPYRAIRPRKNWKPWFTEELRTLVTGRNQAWRRYRRLGRREDLLAFRSFRGRLRAATRRARATYYRDRISEFGDPSSAWRIVGELGLGSRARNSFALPVDVDRLNEHFIGSSIDLNLRDSRPTARIPPQDRFFFNKVTCLDVLEAVKRGRSNARGVDDISLSQLRMCLRAILPVLCDMFNASLQSGVFPSLWRGGPWCALCPRRSPHLTPAT
ncbi:unnamed protein product [Trichogramma brassicae]|uniref:Endonuclease/exonuclease/phosphatase domain-containing protein n=1 Tax=Trichogramma brassicae TaxID=86971 RepID=A0A6H5IYC6_9HYME|nr:unnamed protein product [Trichogramma brassicae]